MPGELAEGLALGRSPSIPSGKTFLSISDAAIWLRGTIAYDGRTMKGVSNAVIGRLLGPDGKPLRDDRERDSEGATLIDGGPAGGTAYISFERHHRILRYPVSAQKFGPPTGSLPLPPGTKRMRPNRGLEAIALLKARPLKGAVVAFSESLTDKNGDLQAWLIGGLLQDHFRSSALKALTSPTPRPCPTGVLSCSNAASATASAHRGKGPEVRCDDHWRRPARGHRRTQYQQHGRHRPAPLGDRRDHPQLVSDDNYSALQRTLLMQFAVPEGKPVLAEPSAR